MSCPAEVSPQPPRVHDDAVLMDYSCIQFAGAMIPFPLYYVLDVFKGALSPLALVMSAVADVAEGHLRATIFSLLMLTMSIAMVIAAGLGGLLSASTASHVSVVGYTINLLLIVYALPGAPAAYPADRDRSCTPSLQLRHLIPVHHLQRRFQQKRCRVSRGTGRTPAALAPGWGRWLMA